MEIKQILSWILRLTIAIILLQTLYFKFTAHPDSVYIFSALGAEPYGRIGLGVIELFVAIMILLPRTKLMGIFSSMGIMIGAIFSHLLFIGIHISNDGGALFILALIVMLASLLLIFIHRNEFVALLQNLKK